MKTNKLLLIAILMAASTFLFVGCKKEKDVKTNVFFQSNGETMLHFASMEEYYETRQAIMSMNKEERREWERLRGFQSFATKSEKLFETFETKGIDSDDDIYDFVKENSNYYCIDELDGEMYLRVCYEDSPFFMLMNESQLLAVGDTVYKVFDHYVAKGLLSNAECISKLKEGVFDDGFKYDSLTDQSMIKEWQCDCGGVETTFRSTESNNRLLVRFYLGPNGATGGYRGDYLIRPYHKTLGVWYFCTRTISYNFTATWKFKNASGGGWLYNSYSAQDLQGTKSSAITGELFNMVFVNITDLQFYSFSGWADTPDVPTCSLTCLSGCW